MASANSNQFPETRVQRLNDNHQNHSQNQNPSPNQPLIDLNEPAIRIDGMTHSLPHRKHGPYTCPKCRAVLSSSQSFAAHASTHYKAESFEERNKRLETKYKKKILLHVQSDGGVKIKPLSKKVLETFERRKMVIRNARMAEENVRANIQGEGQGFPGETSNPTADVKHEIEKGHGTSETNNPIFGVKIEGGGYRQETSGSTSHVCFKSEEKPMY